MSSGNQDYPHIENHCLVKKPKACHVLYLFFFFPFLPIFSLSPFISLSFLPFDFSFLSLLFIFILFSVSTAFDLVSPFTNHWPMQVKEKLTLGLDEYLQTGSKTTGIALKSSWAQILFLLFSGLMTTWESC